MPGAQVQVEGRDSLGRNQPVGISDAVAATQALTLSGNAVAGETFTTGYQIYTWVAALTIGTPNQVLVGNTAAISIVNGTAAINGGGGGDTLFTAATPVNKFVTAVATSATAMTVTAKETGAGPNAIPTTETMSNASWGATTLTGGAYGGLLISASGSAEVPSGTLHGSNLVASGSVSIPIGAFNVGILLLTGTGTYTTAEGTKNLTIGQAINIPAKLAVACVVTMANPGTADYNYLA